MKRIVLKSGLISGAILAALIGTMPLCLNGTIDFQHQEILGYTTMVLAFLMVFFGIRKYRDTEGGGTITFGRAFRVGLGITLIASAFYVVTWEIVYFGFMPDFGDKYAAYLMKKMEKEGATPEALAAKQKEMDQFRRIYRNPVVNVGMTFVEVFPVGFLVTLVSAAVLRRKTPPGEAQAVGATV